MLQTSAMMSAILSKVLVMRQKILESSRVARKSPELGGL